MGPGGRVRAAVAAAVTVATLLLGAAGCAGEQDGSGAGGADRASARLDRQRHDVRAVARRLLRAVTALGGRTTHATAAWRGCASDWLEEYAGYRYLAQARVELATQPDGRDLRSLLTAAGLRPRPLPGTARAGPSRAGASADVTAVLRAPGGGVLGVEVLGPCVEVPEPARHDWSRRRDPRPGPGTDR